MNSLLGRLLASRGLRRLGLIFALGGALLYGVEWLGGPEAIRATFGLGAAAFLVPVHAVLAVSPFPSEIFALAHGAIYGFELGALFTWAGWMLGAWLEYALFRRIAADVGDAANAARLPAWLRRFPAHHPAFLVLGRLVPFGNHVVNAMAGSRGVAIWRFSWTTAVALAPFSIFVAAIGSGLIAQ